MARSSISRYKRLAAEYAVRLVQSGMIVGLGDGSTAGEALRVIGGRIRSGDLHDIVAIPCSTGVKARASEEGIPLSTLYDHPAIDLTIDGADEVAPDLSLIKGRGGALLREKIVAGASLREIIVVDDSKLSHHLGTTRVLPVEVVPFGWVLQARYLEGLGAQVELRRARAGGPFLTDQGDYILDCRFGAIERPRELARRIKERPGVVEHGIFCDVANDVIVAGPYGIRHLTPRGEIPPSWEGA